MAASALAAGALAVRAGRARRRAAGPGRPQATRRVSSAPPATEETDASSLPEPADEPAGSDLADEEEEQTTVADLLAVSDLEDEVRVVDEYPRYHLNDCASLEQTSPEALPVREARQLGFTPCARCRPDAELAARHRAARAQ